MTNERTKTDREVAFGVLNSAAPNTITKTGELHINAALLHSIFWIILFGNTTYVLISCFFILLKAYRQREVVKIKWRDLLNWKNFFWIIIALGFGPGTAYNDVITQGPICFLTGKIFELAISNSFIVGYFLAYVLTTMLGVYAYRKVFKSKNTSFKSEIYPSFLWASFTISVMIVLNKNNGMFEDLANVTNWIYSILPDIYLPI